MDVTVKKHEISKYANNIIDYSADFKDQIKKFASIIDSINSAWKGADALAYINVMKEKYIIGMNEIQEIIAEYGNYLKSIPDAYSTLDESFASKNIEV